MVSNRAEGSRSNAGVKPSAIVLSRDFTPKAHPQSPMTLAEMKRQAVSIGLKDGESGAAEFILNRCSYQHISEYFPLLDEPSCTIVKSFKTINLMMFLDRKFQSILMEYIGLFELQLRSRYSEEMSIRYGAFAHRNQKLFKDQNHFDRFLQEYASVYASCLNRKNSRTKRDIETYGDMPIWEAIEEMPIGMVSKLFKNTKPVKVRKAVAESFGENSEYLESWLRTITFVRNRCAHYGKLLGSTLSSTPKKMTFIKADNSNPFYIVLLLMRLLRTNVYYNDVILLPSAMLATEITGLFLNFEKFLPCMKIPSEWQNLLKDSDVSGIQMNIGYGPKPPEKIMFKKDQKVSRLRFKKL